MTSIKIEFEKGGIFTANLLEQEAPKTCAAFLNKLPISLRFCHSMTSGESIVTITPDIKMERENQRTVGIYPGTLCFLVENPSMRVPNEVYITYGIYFIPRGLKVDYQEPVNVFGRIESGLEELEKVGDRILMSGAETAHFSLIN
jgi:hypothetical protein